MSGLQFEIRLLQSFLLAHDRLFSKFNIKTPLRSKRGTTVLRLLFKWNTNISPQKNTALFPPFGGNVGVWLCALADKGGQEEGTVRQSTDGRW